jgi:5-methyltetrahydrofolate--homocysteine methyltransferase
MSGAVWRLARAFGSRVLLMDGDMDTVIQARDLFARDFGGPALEGCNEHLNLTRPDVIRAIHEAYLDAGADLMRRQGISAGRLPAGPREECSLWA